MKILNEEVIPVLLGGDLNAYSMAIAFAERYGGRSYCFARERLAVCDLSLFIELAVIPELDDCNVAVPALLEFAKKHRGARLILIPCADWYVEMVEYARDKLEEYYFFHIPDFEVWRAATDKSGFVKMMKKYGIPHPKTEIFGIDTSEIEKRCMTMRPPFVVKPSDSSLYWRYKFDGMKKVYFADSLDEVKRIAGKIFSRGYTGKLLVQEYIGGASSREPMASVLTVYLDKTATATRAVLGDVLLEEMGDTARGNYSAIITRPLDGLSKKIISMLEAIGYTGIANLDILTDHTGSYCLELNARQGRSFDHLRIAGVNLSELLVKELFGEKVKPCFDYDPTLWRAVRWRTVMKHTKSRAHLKRATALERAGKVGTPYNFKRDNALSHKIYVLLHLHREAKRYRFYSKGTRYANIGNN